MVGEEIDAVDVVVVGGGISGLIAAVRAAEHGLKVRLLEKGDEERYICNSRYTGGNFHVCHRDVNDDENALVDAINANTVGAADPDLVRAVARNSRVAVQWMKGKGVRFIKAGLSDPSRFNTLAPPPPIKPGLDWEGRGGDVAMRTLRAVLEKLGGKLMLGARAVVLLKEGDRCVGVEVEHKSGRSAVRARNVVICDGGFQADHALLREFVTKHPDRIKQRGAGVSVGDGLKMARGIGARIVGMDHFYGHTLCREAMQNDQLWPYPTVDSLCTAGVVVDAAGRRFVDEGKGGVYIANCVAKLDDPLSATVIFDDEIWNGPARQGVFPCNPLLLSAGATIFSAPDLPSLAAKLALPGDVLKETMDRFNASVDASQTQALTPSRTSSKHKARAIRKPPYHAIQLCAGITYTMGGLAIDGAARVLDEANQAIPGLYAAGCAVGGIEGWGCAGYVGGLTRAAVTGLLAADHIAATG